MIRDWGWADDYMDAVFRRAQLDPATDLVIAGGRGVSLLDMVRHGLRRVGIAEDGLLRIDPDLVRPADLPCSVGDPRRTFDLIGWAASCTGPGVLDRLFDHAMAEERPETPAA